MPARLHDLFDSLVFDLDRFGRSAIGQDVIGGDRHVIVVVNFQFGSPAPVRMPRPDAVLARHDKSVVLEFAG